MFSLNCSEKDADFRDFFCRAGDHSSNNKNVETPWVALILGKVAAGQGCLMRHDNTTLTAPPQGYDSASVSGLVPNRVTHIRIPSR